MLDKHAWVGQKNPVQLLIPYSVNLPLILNHLKTIKNDAKETC